MLDTAVGSGASDVLGFGCPVNAVTAAVQGDPAHSDRVSRAGGDVQGLEDVVDLCTTETSKWAMRTRRFPTCLQTARFRIHLGSDRFLCHRGSYREIDAVEGIEKC